VRTAAIRIGDGFSGYPSRIIPAAVARLAKGFEKGFEKALEKPLGRQRRS
jgi:hypothetical protein